MPALVTTNVFEAFRFINHPVLKEAGKCVRRNLRHKVKKLGKKIKKLLLNPFHLKCRYGAPPPSQCSSTGTQTVPSTLLAQLSHEGDIDMAHHGEPNPKHSLNSNNHNEKMLSQQPKLIPLTTRNNPMTATATANKAPTTGTVKAPAITDSSHKQAVLPSKLSIAEKGKAVTSFMHTQSNQSVQLRPKLSASMSNQQHMSSFNSADSGYNSHMRWRSSSDVSNRTSHRSSCTSGQSFSSNTRRQSISEPPTRVSGAPKRSQSMDSSQRIRGNRSQVLRKSASMTSLLSGSRCLESMPSARISNDDHTQDGSGKKQNVKNERTISPTYNMFADMLKSVRAYCGVGYKSLKCQTSCGLENILSSGGVVGLPNLGNTCYMNSTLQCLSHTVEMTQAFLGLEKNNYKSMLSISRAYKQLMQEMWLRPSSSHHHSNAVAPRELKEKLGRRHPDFAGCIQNDSQEFLRVLLSELHEDMKTKTSLSEGSIHSRKSGWASFEDSPVSRVFQGQLRSTLSCDVCKRSSMTLDPFWDLSVPVQEQPKEVQLEDSLNLFTKKEVLKGENKPIKLSNKCLPDPPTHPPKHTPSFSQALSKMPKMSALNETNDYREISTSACITKFFDYKLLIISDLMRFSGWLHPAKISTPVDIPNSLDMSRYASPETANEQYKGRRITYELYAMSNHSGSVSCGHYTASVKHYASNHWYTFNDSRVTRNTSLDQTSKARNSSKQAYILFYRRCVTAS